MKLTSLLLTVGAIALSLSGITTPVSAEAAPRKPLQIAQAPQQAAPTIKLTPQQQTQIKQIRANANTQFQKVLTSQQKNQIKAALQAGKPAQQAFASIKLTPQQQNQIRQIMVAANQKIEAVLTPEQKKQILQYRQSQQRKQ
ncbi:hypothetical protein [Calothrix sp. 336/3]|uniref:hypothetical protein n=1 Tax=Calothrix sp. 336/3 TaxID=1337936 RepID=UPI0004E44316|nr:hypothetical protein [Calothrix sp. 336/3]AKG23881.1 hypothetical protein IJ00_23555 [Calothrix sp. 336/3]